MKALASLLATVVMVIAATASAASRPGSLDCRYLSTTALSQNLDRRAQAGDGRAAVCLAIGIHSLDGGELEDALMALGRYGDHHPTELLALTHRGTLSRRSLIDAITMLPSSVSDHFAGQERALLARRDRFRKVSKTALLRERALVLRSIDSTLAEIRAQAATQ